MSRPPPTDGPDTRDSTDAEMADVPTTTAMEQVTKTIMPFETDFCNGEWRNNIVDVKPEVLYENYGPGEGKPSVIHERAETLVVNGILAPDFEPGCVGGPLLWNDASADSEYAGYKVQYAWGKHIAKKFVSEVRAPDCGMRDKALYIREFLANRPLAADLPRWMDYWTNCRRKAMEPGGLWADISEETMTPLEEVKSLALKPEMIEDKVRARRCADLFDWDELEQRTIHGVKVMSVPFKMNIHRKRDDKVGYHGTNVYALYSQCYHGKLRASETGVHGDRTLKGLSGVYIFSSLGGKSKIFDYALATYMDWPGMFYRIVWEVLYHDPVTDKGGAAADQTVVDAENVHLYNLLIIPIQFDEMMANYHWVIYPMSDKPWGPFMEANPIDPSSSQCSFDKRGHNSLLAENYVAKIMHDKRASASAAASTANPTTPPAISMEKVATAFDFQVEKDLKKELVRKMRIAPSAEPIIKDHETKWIKYAFNMLARLKNLIDPMFYQHADAALTRKLHPLAVLYCTMQVIGDGQAADELMNFYMTGRGSPPDAITSLDKGVAIIVGDSVFGFTAAKGKASCEWSVRERFGGNFNATTSKQVVTYGKDYWRLVFEQASDPGGSSTLLVHIIDHAVNRVNDIMNEKHDLFHLTLPCDQGLEFSIGH